MKKIAVWIFLLGSVMSFLACSGDSNPDPTTLSVNPASAQFPAEGGSQTIDITSNGAWTVTHNTAWVEVSPESGNGNGSVVITAATHNETTARSAIVSVTAGGISREIAVQQAAGTDPGTPNGNYDVPPDPTGMRDLTSVELTQQMGVGWNIGNSLDAIGGETNWGNPLITPQLIQAVKAAGFNAIRVPVAWSRFSDEANFVIDTAWMDRVEEVVNYVLDEDMYVVMNIHWDNGWMQPTYAEEEYVNRRLAAMWKQIATRFRDYDDRLLFAGTNEVMVEGDYGTPTEEYYTVQNGFNQTFVDAVRATGGRNVYRHLVVQGFNTNIDHTVNFAEIPDDVTDDRLLMEVHYYDPYNFTLNTDSNVTQWGSIATDPDATETWANESWVDEQFQKMKTNFVDQGVGVILGEYGVVSRPDVADHETYRNYWNEYITRSAVEHGLVPFYWDNGFTGDGGMGLFDRNTGAEVYPALIDAITGAAQ